MIGGYHNYFLFIKWRGKFLQNISVFNLVNAKNIKKEQRVLRLNRKSMVFTHVM